MLTKYNKKKLFILFSFLNLVVISAKGADVEFRNIIPTYHPLEVVYMSSIKINKKVPPNKYIRLTISYALDKETKEISVAINGSPKVNCIYFSITKMQYAKPRLYIIGLMGESGFVAFKHCQILGDKPCNILHIYYNSNLSLNLGEEVILGRTFKAKPATQGCVEIGFFNSKSKSNNTLPKIEFKLKAELDDSPDIFLLKRDLRATLDKMTLKQQHIWLNKELDRRAEMQRKGNAAIGDLNTICKYRMEVEKKLGLR